MNCSEEPKFNYQTYYLSVKFRIISQAPSPKNQKVNNKNNYTCFAPVSIYILYVLLLFIIFKGCKDCKEEAHME